MRSSNRSSDDAPAPPLGARVNVRLTAQEHAAVAAQAKEVGRTLSDFVRRRVTGQAVHARVDVESIAVLLRELRRTGGLFKAAYLAGVPGALTAAALLDVQRAIAAIEAAAPALLERTYRAKRPR